jgi:hypothetical protein
MGNPWATPQVQSEDGLARMNCPIALFRAAGLAYDSSFLLEARGAREKASREIVLPSAMGNPSRNNPPKLLLNNGLNVVAHPLPFGRRGNDPRGRHARRREAPRVGLLSRRASRTPPHRIDSPSDREPVAHPGRSVLEGARPRTPACRSGESWPGPIVQIKLKIRIRYDRRGWVLGHRPWRIVPLVDRRGDGVNGIGRPRVSRPACPANPHPPAFAGRQSAARLPRSGYHGPGRGSGVGFPGRKPGSGIVARIPGRGRRPLGAVECRGRRSGCDASGC